MSKFIPLQLNENKDPYRSLWNPLRFMTTRQAEDLLQNYRSGRISTMQLVFDLVEESNLTLQMCIQRRLAAIGNNDWAIKPRNMRTRKIDRDLQDEQIDFLNQQFSRAEDDGTFLPAIRRLAKGCFNGLGVVAPKFDKEGLVGFSLYDPWNFAIDPQRDESGEPTLFWNPDGTDVLDFQKTLERIPNEQIIVNIQNPIDRYGLLYCLAESLGIESYNSLIARRGLPATYIVASEDTTAEDITKWAKAAVETTKGGSGAFPFGSSIITQGIDPGNGTAIREYLEYLQKQLVLASTGGSLQSLAEATGLGSNVADAQADVFKSIVRSDCSNIGDLINKGVAKRLLDIAFPGKPHLVYFDLMGEEKESPEKYLQDAAIAHNAGIEIDLEQLQELTGYKLRKQEAPAPSYVETWSPSMNDGKKPVDDVQDTLEDKEEEYTVNNAEDTDEPVGDDYEPSEDKVEKGTRLLSAFDKMLMPIRRLFAKLFKAKNADEEKDIIEEINLEMEKIENADDTDYQKAVFQILKNEFENTAEKEQED